MQTHRPGFMQSRGENIPARGVVHTCGLRPRWERLHLPTGLPVPRPCLQFAFAPRSVAVISVNPKLAAIALVICAFARRQCRRVELRCRVTLHDNARRTVKHSPTRLCARVFVRRAKNPGNNVRESDIRTSNASPRNGTHEDGDDLSVRDCVHLGDSSQSRWRRPNASRSWMCINFGIAFLQLEPE